MLPDRREAELQDEVRQLKAMVRELSTKVDQLSPRRQPAAPRTSGADAARGIRWVADGV